MYHQFVIWWISQEIGTLQHSEPRGVKRSDLPAVLSAAEVTSTRFAAYLPCIIQSCNSMLIFYIPSWSWGNEKATRFYMTISSQPRLSRIHVGLVIWRLRVWSPSVLTTFFYRYWSWNNNHRLPSTDARRTVVSFWQKNMHKYWLTA